MASLVHVAVEKAQLEGVVKCHPDILRLLVSLLEKLGPLAAHPGFMHQHSIDSVGKYIDDARFDEIRAQLVSGKGVDVTYRVRKFDVISCEAADNLPSAQRRQCVAVRGMNEVARRLEPSERGSSEIVVAFTGGGTLSVRQNRHPQRMVVLCTSTRKVKKAFDALLRVEDAPQLARLFAEAAGGVRQEAAGPINVSRLLSLTIAPIGAPRVVRQCCGRARTRHLSFARVRLGHFGVSVARIVRRPCHGTSPGKRDMGYPPDAD